MYVRKAKVSDVHSIHALINSYAQEGLMLARALSELYDHLRDYTVVVDSSSLVGVCGLGICWEDLAEIKSLAVERSYHGRGIGKILVKACIDEAMELGISTVFALTYIPGFFKRLGFHEISKERLPHKVWADCVKCPKFPKCDEVAMIYTIPIKHLEV